MGPRTLRLWPTAEAPSLARGFVRDNCQHLPPPVVDDACLLASEVVTNAVVHAGTMITVAVECGDGRVAVAVKDDAGSAAQWPQPRPVRMTDEHGRGLAIVETVASEWGVQPAADGKAVWFRLP